MTERINRIGMVALLLLLSTSSLFAQGAGIEWDILNQEGMDLYRTGNYDRAVTVANKSLEVAEKNVGPEHPDVATSLNNLAVLYKTQGSVHAGRAALQAGLGHLGAGPSSPRQNYL